MYNSSNSGRSSDRSSSSNGRFKRPVRKAGGSFSRSESSSVKSGNSAGRSINSSGRSSNSSARTNSFSRSESSTGRSFSSDRRSGSFSRNDSAPRNHGAPINRSKIFGVASREGSSYGSRSTGSSYGSSRGGDRGGDRGGSYGGDRGGDRRGSYSSSGRGGYSSSGRGGSRGGFSGGSRGGGRSGGGRRFQGKYISEEKFINKNPKTKEQIAYTPNNTFANFGFDAQIVSNLTKKGYVHPTRIQDESIPHLLQGKNVVGLANTGSGKTAAFALPIIHKLKNRKDRQTALIIAPTRELANQIEDEIKIFAQGMGIYTALCVGGMSITFQKRQLYKNPQIIIGTPGRLKDLFNQRCLNLKSVGTLVLDEADRMLDMGFLKDIESIISELGNNPQSLCFSATITPDISKIIDKIMPEHVTVSVRTSETAEHIAQDVIKVTSGDHKLDLLLKMLGEPHFEKVLIFGEMKHSVQKLAEILTKAGFPSEAIHGNKTQAQRNRSLAAFKTGRVNVLVATDVAARGLDIPNVTHVINFDKPNSYEDYIHRIGRTGRAGKEGQAYTFLQH